MHQWMCKGQVINVLLCRNITRYIGVGGHMEGSLRNAEQAKKVLDSMYLVQEFIDGGNLRKQVLEQVVPTHICTTEVQSAGVSLQQDWYGVDLALAHLYFWDTRWHAVTGCMLVFCGRCAQIIWGKSTIQKYRRCTGHYKLQKVLNTSTLPSQWWVLSSPYEQLLKLMLAIHKALDYLV